MAEMTYYATHDTKRSLIRIMAESYFRSDSTPQDTLTKAVVNACCLDLDDTPENITPQTVAAVTHYCVQLMAEVNKMVHEEVEWHDDNGRARDFIMNEFK